MKWPEDIMTYAKIRSDKKLFQFLNGLDRKFKPIKREILRVDPLPTVEAAYATVRKKAAHQNIPGTTNNEPQGIATGLITGETKGVGFVTKGYRRNDDKKKWVTRDDKAHLKCEECGMSRHTKEQCFRIVGYPDWWTNGNKKRTKSAKTEKEKDIRKRQIIGRGTEREGEEQCDTLSWLRYTSEESCPNQNTTSAAAQEQSSPNISAIEDTVPNLISEVSNSQPSDSLDEIPENIHETIGVLEHEEPTLIEVEEPTLIEVAEKYVLPARSNRGIPPKRYIPEKTSRSSKIDCSETFSLVAKIDTIRVLFSIAANLDVKNAFLHGELKEEVYMKASLEFSQYFKHEEVCKLKKSLYELKQSPRAWFGRFTLAMKKYGYKQSNLDHTLFLRHRGDRVTYLIIYVHGMIIIENDESEIKKLKEGLCAEFEMKDLGNLRYFFGIEVMRSLQGIFICQKKYILDLLAETWMIECKPADTPMITNHKLFMKTKAKLANRDWYQRMIEKLIYLSHTRPDIAYAVGVIFIDADWAGDKEKRRSTSRYFSLVGEALWIRKLVSEIGFSPKESIQIMSDNKAAIQISENPVQHDRTKHVKVDRHFIKEKLEAEIIKLPFVKSEDQLADILTKAVGMVILHKCLNKLNFGDPTIQLEGSVRNDKI
nr:putative RNA-directed DNA polymerase [Tanacetum cinerariifolium]